MYTSFYLWMNALVEHRQKEKDRRKICLALAQYMRCHLPSIVIIIIKVRLSHYRLISIKQSLYMEKGYIEAGSSFLIHVAVLSIVNSSSQISHNKSVLNIYLTNWRTKIKCLSLHITDTNFVELVLWTDVQKHGILFHQLFQIRFFGSNVTENIAALSRVMDS